MCSQLFGAELSPVEWGMGPSGGAGTGALWTFWPQQGCLGQITQGGVAWHGAEGSLSKKAGGCVQGARPWRSLQGPEDRS